MDLESRSHVQHSTTTVLQENNQTIVAISAARVISVTSDQPGFRFRPRFHNDKKIIPYLNYDDGDPPSAVSP